MLHKESENSQLDDCGRLWKQDEWRIAKHDFEARKIGSSNKKTKKKSFWIVAVVEQSMGFRMMEVDEQDVINFSCCGSMMQEH